MSVLVMIPNYRFNGFWGYRASSTPLQRKSGIEVARATTTAKFWWMSAVKVRWWTTFLSTNYVHQRSLIDKIPKNVTFVVTSYEKYCKMYLENTTVCCGFWTSGIIEPIFFKYEEFGNGNPIFLSNIKQPDFADILFQQDGATCLITLAEWPNWKGSSVSRHPVAYIVWFNATRLFL